ncbi:hypothetical protein TSOC_010746, partial [Tetrabaena socialis]
MTLPCMGIYTSNAVTCPDVPGYGFSRNYDLPATSDLSCSPVGNRNVTDLAFQCNITPGCKLFNLLLLDGVVQSCSKKDPVTCPDVPGYTFLKPYYDLLGSDISCSVVGTRTMNDLGSQCSITPGCKLFNLFVRDGWIQSCNKKFPGTADTPILALLVSQQTTLMPQPCMGVYISNAVCECPRASFPLLKSSPSSSLSPSPHSSLSSLSPLLMYSSLSSRSLPLPASCTLSSPAAAATWASAANALPRVTAVPSSRPIPCPNVPGFTFSQYYDLPGHDLSCSPVGTTTMMDLGLQCSITPGCKLFNVFARDGMVTSCNKDFPDVITTTPLASQLVFRQPTTMIQPCMGIYISNAGECVRFIIGCRQYCQHMYQTYLLFQDHKPHPRPLLSAALLPTIASGSCHNWHGSAARRAAVPPPLKAAIIEGSSCVTCPDMPGYTFSQYYDLLGYDISCGPVGNKAVDGLGVLCNMTPDCKMFSRFVLNSTVQSCRKRVPPTTATTP